MTTALPSAGAQTATPPPATPRKRGKRSPGEGRMAAVLLSPTILVLALVIVYPLQRLSCVDQPGYTYIGRPVERERDTAGDGS